MSEDSDKRQHPRTTWIADAQVWCSGEDVHWNVRLTDISEGGCFVDTLVPLVDGSPVALKLDEPSGLPLELPGRILYGQPTIGSAIAFDPLPQETRVRLLKLIMSLG